MTAPSIATFPTFGGMITTVRASWGKATVDRHSGGGIVLSWKLNARTARRWPGAWREVLISFPSTMDVYIPTPILQDIAPILLENCR